MLRPLCPWPCYPAKAVQRPLADYDKLGAAMTNPYCQSGPARASKVAELFTRIAPRYDLINDFQSFGLHRWWKRRLIRLAAPRPGERALDLCCGTGDIVMALSRRGVNSIGLDFTEAMLSIAQRRKAALPAGESSGRLRFVAGDAQELPFQNDSFDMVTISYGLRNLADWTAGLPEMLRVARPGGRVLVLDFGKPDNARWRAVYFAYLRVVVPWLGRMFCGDAQAYAYILESLQQYPAQQGVENQMRALGCRNVGVVQFLRGIMSINYGVKG